MSDKKEKKTIFNVMKLDRLLLATKRLSLVGIVLNILVSLVVLLYSSLASYELFKYGKELILQRNYTIKYVSIINSYSVETLEKVFRENDLFEVFLFEILLPTIIIILLLFLLTMICKKVLELIRDVNDNKDLFTKEKLEIVKSTRTAIDILILLLFVEINISTIILYVIIVLLNEYVVYLFDQCVKNNKK